MTTAECKCGPVELIFVVDSSESIGIQNFTLSKEFVVQVINRVLNGAHTFDGSDIIVVQYSHSKLQELISTRQDNINNVMELKRAIKEMRWLAGGTFTGEALQFTADKLVDHDRHRVAIVLTDGRSDILRDKVPLNVLCKVKNLPVASVGVIDVFHTGTNEEQLQSITCEKERTADLSYTIKTDDYAKLLDESLLNNLTNFICKDKKCPDFTCPAAFNEPTDLLIVLDGSASVGQQNFEVVREVAKNVAHRLLDTAPPGEGTDPSVRVSVMQYSDNKNQETEIGFSSDYKEISKALAEAAYMGKGTDLPDALRSITQHLNKQSRKRVKRRVLIFSDGRSQGDGTVQRIAQQAKKLIGNAEVYAVAVGTQLDDDGLGALVTGQEYGWSSTQLEKHLIRILSYDVLQRNITWQKIARRISLS
uniref:collagen alpha-1(VI) chain-like n=1 Tax=Myxine glutinosa TaxID=7769 RepID=UPI00358F6CB9